MLKLGYSQYGTYPSRFTDPCSTNERITVAQGGDIGYCVARFLALNYPESCKAHHVNMIPAEQPTEDKFPDLAKQAASAELTDFEKIGGGRTQTFMAEGTGYSMMHTTRPQTLAYSMVDSPVGLLAWIYEKLHAWTDDYPWTDEEILTWVSIYAFSEGGPHASQRFYVDSAHAQPPDFTKAARYADVKLGLSRFPKEIIHTPFLWARTLGPVVLDKVHEKGGHFAAWERPEELAADLREMFGRGGGAYEAVEGCSGYD